LISSRITNEPSAHDLYPQSSFLTGLGNVVDMVVGMAYIRVSFLNALDSSTRLVNKALSFLSGRDYPIQVSVHARAR